MTTTKESPELKEAALAGTCTPYVLAAEEPCEWWCEAAHKKAIDRVHRALDRESRFITEWVVRKRSVL